MPINKKVPFQITGIALAIYSMQAEAQSSCDPGFYDPLPYDICLAAEVGKYVPFAGAETQTLAPAGSYVNTTGQSAATLAPPGFYVSSTGQTAATQATAGTYAPGPGATAAIQASLGHFVATDGASEQTPAPSGFYVSSTGQTVATQATAGTYAPGPGATAAIPASPGHYVPTDGASAEIPAERGHYVPGSGATASLMAPIGKYVAETGQSAALDAPEGYFVDSVGQSAATAAPPGFYVSSTGQTAATQATAGTYAPGPGATAAITASPGYFVAIAGAAVQTPASAGFYVPASGSTTALACPSGTTSGVAATSCSAIVTPPPASPPNPEPEPEIITSLANIPGIVTNTEISFFTFSSEERTQNGFWRASADLDINIKIEPDEGDRGESAEFFVVVRIVVAGGELWFMKTNEGYRNWSSKDLADLEFVEKSTSLENQKDLEIFTGKLRAAEYSIFAGYRKADGTLIFTTKPFKLSTEKEVQDVEQKTPFSSTTSKTNGKPSRSKVAFGATKEGKLGLVDKSRKTEKVEISASLTPDDNDLKKQAKIYIVIGHKQDGGQEKLYYKTPKGFFPWSGKNLKDLQHFKEEKSFDKNKQLIIHSGKMPKGNYKVYVGYTNENGEFIYSRQPFEMEVSE